MTSVKDSSRKPSASDFVLGKELGQGNFSRVFLATHKATEEIFAVKLIEKSRIMRMKIRHPNIFNEVNMEKMVLNMLRHPNIIRLYHTFQDANNLYYLMEYVSNGELWDYLNFEGKQIGCSEEQAKFYAADIVNALEYMESRHIVHRDLKPENMIVASGDGHIRIVDFGTAKNMSDISLNGPNFVGTPEYMSPETIENQSVDSTSDLWSFGCILYQLLTGETPFQGGSPYLTFLRVKSGDFDLPEFLSDDAKDLITRLLQKDPKARIPYTDIKCHPFFNEIDFHNHMKESPPILSPEDSFIRQAAHEIAEYARNDNANVPIVFNQTLTNQQRSHLMHVLNRMQILQHHRVYPRFFASNPTGRCLYATKRGYIGYTHHNQNKWDKPFRFVQISGPQLGRHSDDSTEGSLWEAEVHAFKKVLTAANEQQPAFVVFCGNFINATPEEKSYEKQVAAFQHAIDETLDAKIRLIFVPGSRNVATLNEDMKQYSMHFGDDYYSFWVGGVKCLVLNTNLLMQDESLHERAMAQEKWLQQELEHGSLCSHHLCVFSYHPFHVRSNNEDTIGQKGNNDQIDIATWNIPQETRLPYVQMLGEAKVRGLFSASISQSSVKSIQWKDGSNGEDEDSSDIPCTIVLTNSFEGYDPATQGSNFMLHKICVEQEGLVVDAHVI